MKYTLYRIETYGMKNIFNPIVIDYHPLTVDNISKKDVSKIKAIYGTNGVGKSAIMNSVNFYKQLVLNPSLLRQSKEIDKLNKIINKIKKEFYINIIYRIDFSKKDNSIYKNEIIIKFENGIPYIDKESFYELKDQSINGNYTLLYEVNKGMLNINVNDNLDINDYFNKRTLNVLKYSTFSSILNEPDVLKEASRYISEYKEERFNELGVLKYLLFNNLFANDITVFLEDSDIHNELNEKDFELFYDTFINKDKKNKDNSLFSIAITSKHDIILKSQINEYEKNIKGLCKFLKLFKPSLIDIKIEKSNDENFYYCIKKMVYDNYEVDSDYESTGIQKLMRIYNSIKDITIGKTVFIDELDANINGVYLKKLIEYLNKLNRGHLTFTCHNLYPMEYLYKYSNSIDFLGETGKLVPWKKNGNYKPYNQYPDGMIVDSPFNIDAIDFMKVFE